MAIKNYFNSKKQPQYNKLISIVYALIIVFLTFLFFTNDFGLVDIRKISVVVGVGVDVVEEGVMVTAQIGVPKPSESGENTQFVQIEGVGQTVGDAIKVLNAKTGFYPKLLFSKLIVMGESCADKDIFALLDYFYRNEYTQLTPLVAMCKGGASELFNAQSPLGDNATTVIEQLLSDEAKMSGNVGAVTLRDIGLLQNSPCKACYMPYIEMTTSQGSESQSGGGDGETQGEEGEQSGGNSSGGSGSSGQSSFSKNSNSSGDSSGAIVFTCTKTAMFADGKFCGVLDEQQAFALNLIDHKIKHTFVPCETGGVKYTLGLRECKGGIKLNFAEGKPLLKVNFCAMCQIQDESVVTSPKQQSSKVVPQEVLSAGEDSIKQCFEQLFYTIIIDDCDALGVKNLLYRYNYKYFEKFSDSLLQQMGVEYSVKLKSCA